MKKNVKIDRKDLSGILTEGEARTALEKSALALKPPGSSYQGSAAIHFYKATFGNEFYILPMTQGVAGMPEPQMDAGLKELRRTLMELCGRKVD